MVKSRFLWASVAIAATLLMGCGKKTDEGQGAGRYGMMGENTPEFAAVKFFDHLYHDKNINRVLRYSSPRMSRLINSYRTNRNVQRHVLNLVYDTVNMEIDSGRGVGMSEFATEAEITIIFDGKREGDTIKDLRTVEMMKTSDGWKVDRVKSDLR